jgi:transposase
VQVLVVRLGKTESALVRSLRGDSLLRKRVQRLMSIPAIGPLTALTWALEVGEVQRFSSIKKAISYCGLCGAEKTSANTIQLDRHAMIRGNNKNLKWSFLCCLEVSLTYTYTTQSLWGV